jgi:rRNA maturation endonuclease Nob1
MTRHEYLQSATKPTPERYCEYCGKKLERKRFSRKWEDLGVFKKRKYCDRDCMRKAYVITGKNHQSDGPAHHSSRLIVHMIESREQKCEICGKANVRLDVHHKDGNYNNNFSANLMLICRSCHMKIHRPKSACIICGRTDKICHGYCNKHYLRWKKYGDPLMAYNKKVSE